MKNKVCILLSVFLLLFAGGCRERREVGEESLGQERDTGKLRVVTTIYPPYDFACQVGRDLIEITMLLKPGMESHAYEPAPVDMIRIMESDVFLYAGGESDAWVDRLLEETGENLCAYPLLSWVDPLEEETSEGMQVRRQGHSHGRQAVHLEETEYDEHVWTSPRNAMIIVEEICRVFSEADPENADTYRTNADAYLEELQKLDEAFWQVVKSAKRKVLVFGDRFPLLYFVRTYGLDFYAAFPGCSMETEPSAAMIAFLTDKVREEQIPVVFHLEMSNGKIAEAIAESVGVKTAVFYSGHSITAKDLAAGEDYLSLMNRNLQALREALCR